MTVELEVYVLHFSGLPKPAALFPLNRATRGKDLRKRNPSARPRNVQYVRGPYGRRGGSTRLLGRGNSYIQFPNRGGMDTTNSITILAWVYPEGRAGPIFNFHPNGDGVQLWVRGRYGRILSARFPKRRLRKRTPLIQRRVLRTKKWQFVAAKYNQKNGYASLFVNGKRVAVQRIGRIKIATNYPARMGARLGKKQYFKGRVACLQIYKQPLNRRQIIAAKRTCSQRKTFISLFCRYIIIYIRKFLDAD